MTHWAPVVYRWCSKLRVIQKHFKIHTTYHISGWSPAEDVPLSLSLLCFNPSNKGKVWKQIPFILALKMHDERGGGKQCRSVHRWVEFCSSGYVCCLITLARFSPTQRGSNKTFNGVTSSLTTLFLFPSQAMYSACCTVSPSSTTVCSTIWDVGVRRPSSRWWSWIARWAAHANASGRSAPDWPHRDQPSS